MDHCVETRVVDTGGAASNIIINRRATIIHWITVNAQALNTQADLLIYDGPDAGAKLVWQLEPGYSRHHNFIPGIGCKTGVFIHADANVASYTIGYCPFSEAPFKQSES